jgi:hypothetical protein
MKILLFLLIPILLFGQTTYYVDATDGLNGNTGLSPAQAWQTIAKVNGETYSAGDSILFQRGEQWREQLTVPSSGTSGNVITFGNYGSGALPIFDGSVDSSAGDWIQHTDSIYALDCDWTIRSVFEDDEQLKYITWDISDHTYDGFTCKGSWGSVYKYRLCYS